MAAVCLVLLLVLSAFFDLRMQREALRLSDQMAFAGAVLLAAGLVYGIWAAVRQTYGVRDEAGVPVLVSVMRSTLQITAMIFVILICFRLAVIRHKLVPFFLAYLRIDQRNPIILAVSFSSRSLATG